MYKKREFFGNYSTLPQIGPHFVTLPRTRVQPNFQLNIGRRRGHYENCNMTKGVGVGNKGNIDKDGCGLQQEWPLGVLPRPLVLPERQLEPSRRDQAPNWPDCKH